MPKSSLTDDALITATSRSNGLLISNTRMKTNPREIDFTGGGRIMFGDGKLSILDDVDIRDYEALFLPGSADVRIHHVWFVFEDTKTYVNSTDKVDEVRYL